MTINIDTTLYILFMFGLLILAVGYFIVEILEGREYFWRKHLERYNNSLFDRILHYTIWGILANIGVLLFEIYFNGTKIMLLEIFNNGANISSGVIGNHINRIGIQIFVFYFLYLLAVICLFWGGKRIIKAISWIGKIANKKLKSKKTQNENLIKKIPKSISKMAEKKEVINTLSKKNLNLLIHLA